MSDIQLLSGEELDLIREHGINKHNFIVIRDENNEILQVAKNLVVRTGREFDLRKIFGLPYSGETIANLNSRTLCVFGIGTGGTPVGSPFTPISPTAADTDLNSRIPFRSATASSPLSTADAQRYTDAVVSGAQNQYFKKTFNGTPTVTVDATRDQVYVKVPLAISSLDARDTQISEIGLYTANVPAANSYNGFRLFSRITFQTEALPAATSKALNMDYYVYA